MSEIKSRLNNIKNSGFTLIELVVVVAIMAVLALIMVPNISAYVDRAKRTVDEDTTIQVHTTAKSVTAMSGWPFKELEEKVWDLDGTSKDSDVDNYLTEVRNLLGMSKEEAKNYTLTSYPDSSSHSLKITYFFRGQKTESDKKYKVEVTDSQGGYEVRYRRPDQKTITTVHKPKEKER